jgi:hypothetical protein
MERHIASPKPMPFSLMVNKGSKTRPAIEGSSPGPASSIEITSLSLPAEVEEILSDLPTGCPRPRSLAGEGGSGGIATLRPARQQTRERVSCLATARDVCHLHKQAIDGVAATSASLRYGVDRRGSRRRSANLPRDGGAILDAYLQRWRRSRITSPAPVFRRDTRNGEIVNWRGWLHGST